jgi:hypothetical protein
MLLSWSKHSLDFFKILGKNMTYRILRNLVLASALLALPSLVAPTLAKAEEANNGTDPTKPTKTFQLTSEYLDIGQGLASNTFKLRYIMPVFNDGASTLQFQLPFGTTNFLGDSSLELGDFSLKLQKVLTVTREYGLVVSGEVIFDTASRADLGAGSTILKPGIIYAKFLQGGAILAPSLLHSETIGEPAAGRSRTSTTVFDLYFVPKLPNPKHFMTVDPAVTHNWVTDTTYGALAVTLGTSIETSLPGSSLIFIKPSIGIGHDRPFDWGVELGFKLVGF